MKPLLLLLIVLRCLATTGPPTDAEREVDWEAAERMYRAVKAAETTGGRK